MKLKLLVKSAEHLAAISLGPILSLPYFNVQYFLFYRLPTKKRNQPKKHALKIAIDHRRSMLAFLRERDYKRFEWLLEQLNIVYKPLPAMDNWEIVTRRKHQDRLTDLWCDEMKAYRLDEYKQELEQKQPEFLRRKAKVLIEIMEEEKKLGGDISVTEEEVQQAIKMADEIENNLAKSKEKREYFIYEPSQETDKVTFVK